MQNVDIILLNGQVIVILFSLLIIWEKFLLRMMSGYVMQYICTHLLISSNGILLYKNKNKGFFSGLILLF